MKNTIDLVKRTVVENFHRGDNLPVEKAVETVENSANVEFIGVVWGWGCGKLFGIVEK